MKRRVNRRALGVYLVTFLLYLTLIFDLPQRVRVERVSTKKSFSLQNVMGKEFGVDKAEKNPDIWPIFSAFVTYAIDSGELERDCLILVKKGDSLEFKKPYEIIKERDREGLESLIRLVGRSSFIGFLEKKGIKVERRGRIEDVLMELAEQKEREELRELIRKGLTVSIETREVSHDEIEWVMPDLKNLSLREAISRLSQFTSKIRVVGYGEVLDQEPKPYKRIYGETECVLYGIQK